ncbi:hypothetical protein D9M68_781230 [compost metagenome]
MQAKARVAQVTPGCGIKGVLAVVEVGTAVGQVAHRAIGLDFVDAHRLGLVQAEVEELGLERQGLCAPEGLGGLEADVAQLVVSDAGQIGGQLVAVCAHRLGCARFGQLGQAVPVEALGMG